MKFLKSLVLLLGLGAFLLAGAVPALTAQSPAAQSKRAQSKAAQSKVKLELVSAKTDDGIVLYGLIWTPASGKAKIGVVLSAGTYAEFYDLPFDWMGQKLAENGYLAISMNRRDHGLEFGYHNMEAAAADHRIHIDILAKRGAEKIVLAGHSYGTVTVPYYVMTTDDPRVKAMLLFSPLGDLRPGSVIICGGKDKYDAIVAQAKEMVAAGKGKEAFMIPPMVPGGRPIVNTYENFLDKRGPDSKAAPVEILKSVGSRPMLGIRDPGDPFPATLPPAQQMLMAANPNLEYVLLPDIRKGKTDPMAHYYLGRENEVFKITLDWLKKKGLK